MEILMEILAGFGGLVLLILIFLFFDEWVIAPFRVWRYRKSEVFWVKQIKALQYSWKGDKNYDEMVKFTIDFLRNSDVIKG